MARLTFPKRVRGLRVEVDLVVEMAVYDPFDFFLEPSAEQFPFSYDEAQRRELQPFLLASAPTPRFADYAQRISRRPRRTVDALVELNRQLQSDISYVVRLDPGVQTVEETLHLRSGSCRDSAWLLVQLCRHLGLAARFVSGYLIQLMADVKPVDGPAGPARPFPDPHAWCEVYLPGAGWIGLIRPRGCWREGHLPLAMHAGAVQCAAPVPAPSRHAKPSFTHEMSVAAGPESPRVTRPYTDTQWNDIVRLGHAVDAELARHDVRLTMGGEPTFVGDRSRRVEWKTAAMGPPSGSARSNSSTG